MNRHTAVVLLLFILLGMPMTSVSDTVPLQVMYDEAGSGDGYDKLVILDSKDIYTGSMMVDAGIACALRGNGALIILDSWGCIWAPRGALLDISECVITAGSEGLIYEYSLASRVENCTIVGNGVGIFTWSALVTITNCIIADNSQYGVACLQGFEPIMLYNDVWNNGQFNCASFCPT